MTGQDSIAHENDTVLLSIIDRESRKLNVKILTKLLRVSIHAYDP